MLGFRRIGEELECEYVIMSEDGWMDGVKIPNELMNQETNNRIRGLNRGGEMGAFVSMVVTVYLNPTKF